MLGRRGELAVRPNVARSSRAEGQRLIRGVIGSRFDESGDLHVRDSDATLANSNSTELAGTQKLVQFAPRNGEAGADLLDGE